MICIRVGHGAQSGVIDSRLASILERGGGGGQRGGKAIDLLSSPATKRGRERAYVNPLAER